MALLFAIYETDINNAMKIIMHMHISLSVWAFINLFKQLFVLKTLAEYEMFITVSAQAMTIITYSNHWFTYIYTYIGNH